MALLRTVTTSFGNTVDNAYSKIDTFSGDRDNIRFVLNTYISQDARNTNKSYIAIESFIVPYVDGMSIASLYAYLKTLPEFAGSVDSI